MGLVGFRTRFLLMSKFILSQESLALFYPIFCPCFTNFEVGKLINPCFSPFLINIARNNFGTKFRCFLSFQSFLPSYFHKNLKFWYNFWVFSQMICISHQIRSIKELECRHLGKIFEKDCQETANQFCQTEIS